MAMAISSCREVLQAGIATSTPTAGRTSTTSVQFLKAWKSTIFAESEIASIHSMWNPLRTKRICADVLVGSISPVRKDTRSMTQVRTHAPDTAVPAEEKETKRTLAQKILAIQDAVGVVKKLGKFGSEMGGANYLRIEDAVVAVNKLLSQNKVILTGSLVKTERTIHERVGKDGNLARSGYISNVLMTWTLDDTETG
jgi:hypothetical protein